MLPTRSATDASTAALATDERSMDRLRINASHDPKSAIREAAKQFEAVFMREVLKSMREATMKSGLFDGPGLDMQTDMLDQQLVQSMSGRAGLADVIAQQLSQRMGAVDGIQGANAKSAVDGKTDAGKLDGGKLDASSAQQALRRFTATMNAQLNGKASAAAGSDDDTEPSTTPSFDLGRAANTANTDGAATAGDAKREFLRMHWSAAREAERATGIPALNILGQAAHESAWGAREIKNADGTSAHNLFGIKAGANWTGKVAEITTTEYENGVAKKRVQRFRSYDSYADAFRDHAKLLANQPRYSDVVANGKSPQSFASGLQRAGYATDPAYADKLTRVINTAVRVARAGSST